MHRIDGPGATPDSKFTEGDPVTAVPATEVTADWLNAVQEEIVNVIQAAGIALDKESNNQLQVAIRRLASASLRVVQAGSHTLAVDDAGLVVLDASAGSVAVTLPAASALAGIKLNFARIDATANTVTITRAGADTIDGAESITVAPAARWTLMADGASRWISVGQKEIASVADALAGRSNDTLITPFLLAERLRGIPFPFPGETPPPGAIAYDGSELNRDDFPELWAWAQQYAVIVTEAEWHADMWGAFSSGDGVTTFRVPDLRGEFIRGWDAGRGVDAGRVLGSNQMDAMQNITGSFYISSSTSSASGAFSTVPAGNRRAGSEQYGSAVSFDASRVARTADETRGRNIAYHWCAFY